MVTQCVLRLCAVGPERKGKVWYELLREGSRRECHGHEETEYKVESRKRKGMHDQVDQSLLKQIDVLHSLHSPACTHDYIY